MRRDHLVEMQLIGRGETEACRDRAEIGLCAFAVDAGNLEVEPAPQAATRSRTVDRTSEAAKGPGPPPARVEKAEMQARARVDRNELTWRCNPVSACARGTQGLLHCWLEAPGICLWVQAEPHCFKRWVQWQLLSERTPTPKSRNGSRKSCRIGTS